MVETTSRGSPRGRSGRVRTAAGALALSLGLALLVAGVPAGQRSAVAATPGALENDATPIRPTTYSSQEMTKAGHEFFGQVSGGLATVVERAFAAYGEPVGYILGEEGSGAFVGGLRYGEGILYTRAFGAHPIYWQGPSIGWDFGADGARVMMLVYQLPALDTMFQRYTGVNGSAYLIGGFGMTVLAADLTYVVPVRAGLGARLGVNLGYLKFTPAPTWNPF